MKPQRIKDANRSDWCFRELLIEQPS